MNTPYDILVRLDQADLLDAWISLNCFQWPDLLVSFKPKRFEVMTDREKFNDPFQREVMALLESMTDEFDRSEHWWVTKFHRTKEEHLSWWLS